MLTTRSFLMYTSCVPACRCVYMHALQYCICVNKQAAKKTVSTSSIDELDLPVPPATLPLSQQQEYMQLTRKLALHEKKKMKDLKSLSSRKIDPPPSKEVIPKPSVHVTKKGPKPPSGEGLTPLSQPPVSTDQKTDVSSGKPAPTEKEEFERKSKLSDCHKKLFEYAEKMKVSKDQEAKEQHRITDLTNQLTTCVSEIAEHEQKMEEVQEQLKVLQNKLEVYNTGSNACIVII